MHRPAMILTFAASLLGKDGLAQIDSLAPTLDRSPHHTRFVQVNGVRLEMLDWGGHGPVLVFLAGYGLGAHIFDDLAPELTDRFHTIALTPRGFPPSEAPDSEYTVAQLASDVREVLDGMGASKAILVGHSISGAVITQFAISYPEQVLAVVYLDGAYDFGEAQRRSKARKAAPAFPSDTTTGPFQAWRRRYPDWDSVREIDSRMWNIDSAEVVRRNQLTATLVAEVRSRPHPVWRVEAPALSICALGSTDRSFGWLTPDSARWESAQSHARQAIKAKHSICQEFSRRVRRGRVVELTGGHLIFLDCRAAVVRAIRDFVAAVPGIH